MALSPEREVRWGLVARITIAHDRTVCGTANGHRTPLHFVRIAVKTKTHTLHSYAILVAASTMVSSLLRFRKDSISMSTLQAFKTLMAVPQ